MTRGPFAQAIARISGEGGGGLVTESTNSLVLRRECGRIIIGDYIGTAIGIHSPIPC